MSTSTASLSWSMARARIGGLVAVGCAVLGGAAMITVSVVLAATALSSHMPADRLADADVVVAAQQQHPVAEDIDIPLTERVTVPADVIDEVARVPGVAEVAADLTFPVVIADTGARIDAHSWDLAALSDPDLQGQAPDGSRDLLVDAQTAVDTGLELGDTTTLSIFGEPRTFQVAGIADVPGAGVFVDAETAATLSGRSEGAVDLIAMTVTPDADPEVVAKDISAALAGTDLVVSTGAARGDAESVAGGGARGELLALAASLASTLTILIGCITAGAMSVSVANQRRDLALLRAVGATPRQVRRLIATQASIVAAVALVPGIAIGYVAAGAFAGRLTGAGMLPAGIPLVLTPFAVPVVGALMVAAVQVAARSASFRASRMPATEAVTESRVEPRTPSRVRTVVGLLLIASSVPQSILPLLWRNETAFVAAVTGTLVAIIGFALAGPVIVRAVTGRVVQRVSAVAGPSMWLAVHHTRAFSLRTAGSATVLALAIGLTVAQIASGATLASATAAEHDAGLVADATVTGSLSEEDLDDLAAQDGVEAAVPLVPTTVLRTSTFAGDVSTVPHPALAVGHGAGAVVDPDVVAGDLEDLHGDTVALSSSTSGSWDAAVGDTVELTLDNGSTVEPTVVAVYERGFGFSGVMLSTDVLLEHGDPRWYDMALVAGDASAVTTWTHDRPGLEASAGAALSGDDESEAEQTINLFVLLPMLLYILMAVANSLAASTGRRRHELATLRVIGMTRRQILSMVRREAVITAILAIGAGLLVAILPMSLLGLGFLGEPWPHGPWWMVPGIAGLVAVMATTSTTWAARRALRTPPATVLAAQD